MEHRQMQSCWDGKNHPPSQLLNLSFKTYIYYQHAFKATVLHFLTSLILLYIQGVQKKNTKALHTINFQPVAVELQGVQKKNTKALHTINFQPVAVELHSLHQNGRQRLLSINQCKICINWLPV